MWFSCRKYQRAHKLRLQAVPCPLPSPQRSPLPPLQQSPPPGGGRRTKNQRRSQRSEFQLTEEPSPQLTSYPGLPTPVIITSSKCWGERTGYEAAPKQLYRNYQLYQGGRLVFKCFVSLTGLQCPTTCSLVKCIPQFLLPTPR